jgi:hypothetical protein
VAGVFAKIARAQGVAAEISAGPQSRKYQIAGVFQLLLTKLLQVERKSCPVAWALELLNPCNTLIWLMSQVQSLSFGEVQ